TLLLPSQEVYPQFNNNLNFLIMGWLNRGLVGFRGDHVQDRIDHLFLGLISNTDTNRLGSRGSVATDLKLSAPVFWLTIIEPISLSLEFREYIFFQLDDLIIFTTIGILQLHNLLLSFLRTRARS